MFLKLKKFKLNKRWLSFIVLILSFIFLIFPRGVAQAGAGGWFASLFLSLLGLIIYVLAVASTFILGIGSKLLSFVMTTTFSEHLFIDAPFVKVAWSFTRDFANLFFILWLVIIALATIVDVKSYSAKKLLVKLIIVALLVNFSLVLCGFMLDIAQGTMGFLTQSVIVIKGEPFSLADGLSYSFRQSELFGAHLPSGSGFFLGNLDSSISVVMQNLLVLVFSLIAAYVFLILAIMLLVRVVALWLLLIFAPLAWTFGIMPFAKKALSEWISRFFQWAFYGVIVAFLMYLAAMAVWAIQDAKGWSDNLNQGSAMMGSFGTQVSFIENFTSILSFIVVIVLLLMAKGVAMSTAKSGGDMVTGMVAGYIGGKAATWGKKPLGWAGKKTKEKAKEVYAEGKGRVGGVLMKTSNIPIIGGAVARKGADWRIKREEAREERIKKAPDYSKLSKEEQIAVSSKLKGADLENITETMIKNNTIQKLDKTNPRDYETLKKMYDRAKKSGNEKFLEDFETKRLDMITDPSQMQTPQQTLQAEQRRDKILKQAIRTGEVKNEDFVKNLSSDQLVTVLQNPDATKAIGKAFEDFANTTKNTALTKIQTAFTENFDETTNQGKTNIELRKFYAKNSGNYHKAFDLDPNRLNQLPQNQRNQLINESERTMGEAIGKIKNEKEWQKLNDSDENTKAVARHIKSSQLGNAGQYLDSNTKDKIYDQIRKERKNPALSDREKEERKNVYIKMQQHDLWSGDWTKVEDRRKREEKRRKEKEKMNALHAEGRAENIKRDKQKYNNMRDEANKMNDAYDAKKEKMNTIQAKAISENIEYDKRKEEDAKKEKEQINILHGEAIDEDKKRTEEQEKNRQVDKQRQHERNKEARKLRREREKVLEERKKRDEGSDEEGPDTEPTSPKSGPTKPTGGGSVEGETHAPEAGEEPDNIIDLTQGNDGTWRPPEKEGRLETEEAGPTTIQSEGSGWTPQQKNDFEEKDQRKSQEAKDKEKEEMNKMHGEAIEENKLREQEKETKETEERDKKQREERQEERLALEKQRLEMEKERFEMEKQRHSKKDDKKDNDEDGNNGGSLKTPTPPSDTDSGGEVQQNQSSDNKQDYDIRADSVTIQPKNTLDNGNTKNVNLNQKNISTSEGENDPNQTVDLREEEKSRIITPEPRGHIKFSEGPGWTPQQKKDFEEKRQRKYQEAIDKKQKTKLSSQNLDRADREKSNNDLPKQSRPQGQYTSPKVLGNSKTIYTNEIPEKSKISQEGEQNKMDSNLMENARAQIQNNKIEEAIETAKKIQDSEKKGYALWNIAATQAQKGNFSEALRTARQIDHDKIRSLALSDLELAKERMPESYS